MASIDDVARAAGVSTATVSRALRDLPNVSGATRARVLTAARDLGYVPSPSAASLASGRTRTVGVLVPGLAGWYVGEVADGAARALRSFGYDVLLYAVQAPHAGVPRPRVDSQVLRRRVDATLVVGLPLDDDEVRALVDLGVPLGFVGSGPAGEVTHRIDDVAAGETATRLLLLNGHRRVGFVGGLPDGAPQWSPLRGRRDGWSRALREVGVEPDPGWEVVGNLDLAGGRASGVRLLQRHPEVTAVFAATDEMAMGVVLAARELGLRVPQDLSVVGVDGHPHGALIGLTSVAHDVSRQGFDAASALLRRVLGEPGPARVTYPTWLLERSSVASPRAGGAGAR